jgi:shikimate dehydrogenase
MLCGLIGAGIQGSLSPALQEEEARHHGIRLHYQLIDLETAGRGVEVLATLIEAVRVMRFAGLNITHPCKQLVMPLLDELSEEAAVIGAVNTVVRRGDRLVGHNTDGAGWSWGFRRILPAADLSRVTLIGAGGAGSACADAVLRLGAAHLTIVDQDAPRPRPRRAAERISGDHRASASPDLAAALGRASASSTRRRPGRRARRLAVPAELLRPAMGVGRRPRAARDRLAEGRAAHRLRDRGRRAHERRAGAPSFALFTGREPDPARMDAHFRRLVSSGGALAGTPVTSRMDGRRGSPGPVSSGRDLQMA